MSGSSSEQHENMQFKETKKSDLLSLYLLQKLFFVMSHICQLEAVKINLTLTAIL